MRSNPFDDPDSHLSLADIDEARRLMLKWASGGEYSKRLLYLNKRRFLPIYNTPPKAAE